MNAFIFLQFGYCPLVWMFHGQKLINGIDSIYKRALRTAFRDYESTFTPLLQQSGSLFIHQKNLQILATEIFKTKNGLNPVIIEDVFKVKNLTRNFPNAKYVNRSKVNSVKYGAETITSFSAKISKISPNGYKDLTQLSTFKSKIKNWETDECSFRLYKAYICRVGFI